MVDTKMNFVLRIILLQLTSAVVYAQYDSVNFDPWIGQQPPSYQRPVDFMTDVFNDMGIRILQQYVNDGNVAFSPTGVGFVLTALYEGSAGGTKQQIAEALNLPRNRDIMLIGLRDIHRRLRSYLSADGFLGGLTLNKDNIRLRPEYEDVLRFYGFDLSSNEPEANYTTSIPEVTTSKLNMTEKTTIITTVTTMKSTSTEMPVTETTTTSMETTTPEDVLNVTDVTTTLRNDNTTTMASTDSPTTFVAIIVPSVVTISVTPSTTDIPTTSSTTSSVTPSIQTTTIGPTQTEASTGSASSSGMTTTVSSAIDSSTNMPTRTTLGSISSTSETTTTVSEVVSDPETTPNPQSNTPMIIVASRGSGESSDGEGVSNVSSTVTEMPTSEGTNTVVSDMTVPISMQTTESVSATFVGSTESMGTTIVEGDPGSMTTQEISTFGSIFPGIITNAVITGQNIGLTTEAMTTITRIPTTEQTMLSSTTVVSTTEPTTTTVPTTTTTVLMTTTPMTTSTPTTTTAVPTTTNIPTTTTLPTTTTTEQTTTTEPAETSPTTIDIFSTENILTTTIEVIPVPSESTTTTNVDSTTISSSSSTDLINSTIESITVIPLGDSSNSTTRTIIEDSVIKTLLESTVASLDPTTTDVTSNLPNTTEIGVTEAADTTITDTTDTKTATPSSLEIDDSSNQVRRRSTRSPRGYFSSFPDEGIWMQDLGFWRIYPSGSGEASVRDSTELSFLVNGCDVVSVPAATYMAVLPFAFLPSLQTLALEFPLDNPRYNILLLLPADRQGAHRLSRELTSTTLRLIRRELQPAWVRATIPSFMLKGFVTLTPFLQRLGIRNAFEPRMADLSLMTPELGVYARDVQQSIGVNIRNYMKPDRTHSRESFYNDPPFIVDPRQDFYQFHRPGNGLFERAGPVSFTVEHPFLYFIVDAQTAVCLIAGRIDDPLNSRIL